ncbi:alpha/beta hydrolase [Sulfitobacter sp. SK012]|uniref:alpha/beta fold hydrolase n=1 Tax=Sulfitobacter sp. SK012 TaxID=1389005 RepID=UPI000E0BFB19|nr:alpha/beta hydrolase [Sulfitobacter sp. SK012]AXI45972.1 alpha/beta hydrolase [Sulfitobacter sp. SK012]
MSLPIAPLFTDVHPGPASGAAYWANTSDGKQIRLAAWPHKNARGTVLVLPGRSEYIEKYGPAATELANRGFATLCIDWRGQGLADRLLDNRLIGHVETFPDYQKDLATMMRAARTLGLPRPYFMLAHSMGGCIGLRAVMERLPVLAVAFTAPMWGIQIAPHLRLAAKGLTELMPRIGKGHLNPPGTTLEPYVANQPFENNSLTTDREMFYMMRDQILAHPDLALGGPSYQWLGAALRETKHLAERQAPNLPCISFVCKNERIVDVDRIVAQMDNWKGGTLETMPGGEHEVLMEVEAIRTPAYDKIAKLFFNAMSA